MRALPSRAASQQHTRPEKNFKRCGWGYHRAPLEGISANAQIQEGNEGKRKAWEGYQTDDSRERVKRGVPLLRNDLLVAQLVRVVAPGSLLLRHGAHHGGVLGRVGEVAVDLVVVLVLLVRHAALVGGLLGLLALPVGAHVVDLGLVVELWVVLLADASPALPHGQVVRVDGHAVVLVSAALTDVLPSALLLLQVETGGVWEPDEGHDHAGDAEPRDDVELLLDGDVVVQNGGEQSTELTEGGGDSVGGGTDWGWVDLGGDEEGHAVGAELVEERRQEVHGLEGVNAVDGRVVVVVEGGNDEEDEAEQEANLLHPLAAVELVINQEGGQVVAGKRAADVDQVPEPSGHDGGGVGREDLDELGLEELVSVEENIVTEPTTGSGDDATSEVTEGQLERFHVVTSDSVLLLGSHQLLGGQWHLVPSVVDEPEGTDGGDGEGDSVGPLGGHLGVGWVSAAVVEDEEGEDEDHLVEELTPSLHQEGGCDLASTVQTILLGRDTARSSRVLHGCGSSHGVLATDTDTIHEERPSVADNPSVQVGAPRSSKHDQTEEHDEGILAQTPATADTARKVSLIGFSRQREEAAHPSPRTPTRI